MPTNNIPVFIVGQTTLVVGQDVDVAYTRRKDRRGKVVKVTPAGVEVEVADLLRFGNDGYELDVKQFHFSDDGYRYCASAPTLMSDIEELHQQRHHYWEARCAGSI